MRLSVSPLLFLPALLFAYLLSTGVAHASEKKVMGDILVEKGQTADEVRTAWGDITVQGSVRGDVESGFGDIRIEGPVGGDVDAGSGNVYVSDSVGGDVDVGQGNVYMESGGHVRGDVSLHSGSLQSHQYAAVSGAQRTGSVSDFDEDSLVGAFSGTIGWAVMTLGLVAAAVLLAVATPRPLRASARSLEAGPGRSMVVGLISVPVVFILAVLLFVTIVGIPLLLLLWPAYLALVLFGALVAAYFLGRKVLLATGRYRAGDALAAAVGAFLVSAAYAIPVFGGLVFAIFALLGTGAAVSALLAYRSSRVPRVTYTSYEDYLRDH